MISSVKIKKMNVCRVCKNSPTLTITKKLVTVHCPQCGHGVNNISHINKCIENWNISNRKLTDFTEEEYWGFE